MKTFIQLCVVLCNKTRRASLFLLYFLNAVFLVHRESRWQPQLLLCELYALRRASLNWSYPTGSSARLSPAAAAVTLSCLANVRWISTLLSDRSSSTRYRSASYKWNISSQFSFSNFHGKTHKNVFLICLYSAWLYLFVTWRNFTFQVYEEAGSDFHQVAYFRTRIGLRNALQEEISGSSDKEAVLITLNRPIVFAQPVAFDRGSVSFFAVWNPTTRQSFRLVKASTSCGVPNVNEDRQGNKNVHKQLSVLQESKINL